MRVVLGGVVIADTIRAHRVLETSHPLVYYVPLENVAADSLEPSRGRPSFCEWKGAAAQEPDQDLLLLGQAAGEECLGLLGSQAVVGAAADARGP